MSSLELFNSKGQLAPRGARAFGRQIGTIQASTAVDLARIDGAVQRRGAVIDGVTEVTGRALQQTALVSQTEFNLAQTVPHASERLAVIADVHAVAMTGIVMDTAQALSRLS